MADSPKVIAIGWGRVEVAGHGEFKDAKLFPGGAREWDWAETGTRHSPGIQPADVEELLAHGATVIVLSQGMELRLNIMPETLELLRGKGITVHVAETTEAVRVYNELAGAAALIHSTC